MFDTQDAGSGVWWGMAAALYMDAVITPNRSLGQAGFKVVLGILAVSASLLSVVFFAIGAWPAPLFLGLDLVLVYLAFKASFRALERRERLRVSAEQVEVIEEREGVSRTVWTSPTAFTSVDLEGLGEHDMRVRLRLSGRRRSVGRALSPPEREALGQALRDAIRRARAERY
ncbi:MAG TPA: DUF2244 domain-containing protein [Caulobacter sp.]|nr:DUF2244 domain-containing protein [Caulobacter sp.]